MKENYNYPIDMSWTKEEIINVVDFLHLVELANEESVSSQELINGYKSFKKVVPTIAQEKKIDREFFENSGYSIYKTLKRNK